MKKQYTILSILTMCFYSIYLMGFNWENQFPDARQYGGPFILSFVPAFLLYLVFYGCFSYIRTKKLIIPNCLLLLLSILFFVCWTFIRLGISRLVFSSYFPKCLVAGFIPVSISLLFGLLIKFVYYFRKNK